MRTASLRACLPQAGKNLTEVKLVTWQSACSLQHAQHEGIASILSSAVAKIMPRIDGSGCIEPNLKFNIQHSTFNIQH